MPKSLRSNLVRLVLVAVTPLILISCGLLFYLANQEKHELENALQSRAHAVEAVVDDKLNSVLSSLQILALTEEFHPGAFPVIHRKFSRAVKDLNGWKSLSIIDLDGNPLIHTSHPFGATLIPVKDEPFFKEVLKTKKPVFSNLRDGKNTGKQIISVAYPVIKNDRISLILVGNISSKMILDVIARQNIARDWYATVTDKDHVIIARTRMPKEFVGTRVSDAYIKKIKNLASGFTHSPNLEGIDSFSAFIKSPLSGWTIILGFPEANLNTYSDLTKQALLLALCIIFLGIYLALRMGEKITTPIIELSKSAEAFGKGALPEPVESEIKEISVLAKSIELASLQRTRSENAIRTLHEISSSLSGELDLKKLLRSFTDQSTVLTRAEFGAYFNMSSTDNEFMDLVNLSGMPIEVFNKFPLPRKTKIFGPTFEGEGILRLDDVTQDPRYGLNSPFHGIPHDHPPVRSYLAVPVISGSGKVLGGLFFGHSEAGVFTEQDETLMGSLAAHAATAIDNASLYTQATQAIELRDTFLSVASHELKTPLTSLYLQFEVLKRNTLKTQDLDPKISFLFDRFQSQLFRLTRLIDELLDVTRIASGKMNLHLESMDLEIMIQDICGNFENEAIQKGSPISLRVKEKIVGNWDLNRLEQVVTNIISNAIKYGNHKPVDVVAYKNAEWAFIEIQDQGLGIDPDDQARIFQRFERAIDSKAISGLGLGLFICKEIINKHGGDIIVHSTLGKGSIFTIKMPL